MTTELKTFEEISKELTKKMDEKIFRIVSGKFKLKKNGDYDKRFKENRKYQK